MDKIKKGFNIARLLIILSAVFSKGFGQATFTVTPQLVELELAPGARRTFQVLLVNENEKDTSRFRIVTADVFETEAGNYRVIDKGTSKYSCADWIKPDSMELTLGPKQGKEISFEVKAPPKVSGGRYASIVFALLPKVTPFGPDEAGAGVVFHFRIPVQLEVTIKSTLTPRPKNVAIEGIEIIPAQEDREYSLLLKDAAKNALVVKAIVHNRGDMHIKAKGRLVLTDRKGKRLREVPLGAGRGMVLPEAKVKFVSVIKRPLPGDYVLEAVLNYGGVSPAIGRLPFTVARKIIAKDRSFISTSTIGLNVGRGIIEIFGTPNSYRTQVLTITNEENEVVKVKTKLKYLQYDENGNIVATDSGDSRFSCIDWLTIEPKDFELAPGATKTMKVVAKIPDTIPGGRYACINMEAMLLSAKETDLPTPVQVPIILTIPGTAEKKGEVTKVEVSKGNPPTFTVYFKNLGNIHLKPKVKVELAYLPKVTARGDLKYIGEPKSEPVGVFGMKEFPVAVLPGGIAKMEQDYDKPLEPGSYTAVVTVDYGGVEPAVFVQKFQVK
jgi:hypothetical protein